jgi:hypothetical protein
MLDDGDELYQLQQPGCSLLAVGNWLFAVWPFLSPLRVNFLGLKKNSKHPTANFQQPTIVQFVG